jgi:tetratricopeptide (TPR) repeat protein
MKKKFVFTAMLLLLLVSTVNVYGQTAADMIPYPTGTWTETVNQVQGQVIVSPFLISANPITQKEWRDVMGTTIRQQRDKVSSSSQLAVENDNHPMYYVNWFEAVEYCNRRSQREGLVSAYSINGQNVTWNRNTNGYRLPTSAEYTWTGIWMGQRRAIYNSELYEWCWDWWGSSNGGTNPIGPSSGDQRTITLSKGSGGWSSTSSNPSTRRIDVGFRVVCNAANTPPNPTPAPAPSQNNAQLAEAAFNRGSAAYNQENYDRAITEFTEAIRLNPNAGAYYAVRGWAYFNKENWNRAIADFTQVIRLDPKNANTYAQRGYSYLQINDLDKAYEDMIAAFELDPNNELAISLDRAISAEILRQVLESHKR